ncbi:MAG: C40 family peptidase [Lachnospiraceae bacterium]|nr:C40 family peptidase [Lachnospiraceae bacterium]
MNRPTGLAATAIMAAAAVLCFGIRAYAEDEYITSADPIGAMLLYENTVSEEEYIESARELDHIFSYYDHLGIANVSDTLNIREEPSETAELAGRLPSNAVCNVVGEENGWYQIVSGEVEGYVKADYLATGADARLLAKDAIFLQAVVHVDEGKLTVRLEPDERAGALTAVSNGEVLDVVDALGNWVKINLDNNIAYVSSRYVTLDRSLKTAVSIAELTYGTEVNNIRAQLCNYAQQFIGNPYVWGGTSLTKGADCSGYVQTIYKTYGVTLPRVAADQARAGTIIPYSEALPGDLVFYSSRGYIDHVAIYIGNGMVVNAGSPRSGICVKAANYRTITRVVRVLP